MVEREKERAPSKGNFFKVCCTEGSSLCREVGEGVKRSLLRFKSVKFSCLPHKLREISSGR